MIRFNFDNTYSQLPPRFYAPVRPVAVENPELVLFNEDLARTLNLTSPNAVDLPNSQWAALLCGSTLPDGSAPIAMAYAGHQFGHFVMLGDGRAHLLGEHVSQDGRRWDIHLKGSGRTPFTRGGDGRAAIGPMLREYIISEAMQIYGVPTTRSLAVVRTNMPVEREERLTGAVLARVASSHIRVGTFEYAAALGRLADLKALTDYTLQRHHPELPQTPEGYLEFLKRTIASQASLVAKWMNLGFVHGVMNTDNMAISGETIDYGPCAFIDQFDPDRVFSALDRGGRYAYRKQPGIALWNLECFAQSLLPLLHPNETEAIRLATQPLQNFEHEFAREWTSGMRSKLGLFSNHEDDDALIAALLDLMRIHKLDFTKTFQTLTASLESKAPKEGPLSEWLARWLKRIDSQTQDPKEALTLMRQSNPSIIPRNHLVEEALAAAEKEQNLKPTLRLLEALRHCFENRPEDEKYRNPPEEPNPHYQTTCGT